MFLLPKNELNGTSYVLKVGLITLLQMLPTIFFPELAVMPTRSMISESRDSSEKSLDVQKCCDSVAKHIVVMINRLTSTSLAAKDSIKKHWKSMATVDQCQSIAKTWKRQSTLFQPIEDFQRFSIRLLRMKSKRKDCPTFIQKE